MTNIVDAYLWEPGSDRPSSDDRPTFSLVFEAGETVPGLGDVIRRPLVLTGYESYRVVDRVFVAATDASHSAVKRMVLYVRDASTGYPFVEAYVPPGGTPLVRRR